MTTLIFASHNAHKVEEIRALIGSDFVLQGLSDLGFSGEIPETGATLEANAEQKARYTYDMFHMPCFADDTGLEVDALNGAPGVYSARYAGVTGTSEQQSAANVRKLLGELDGVTVRTARFRTMVCYYDGRECRFFEGRVEGRITLQPSGTDGFGYDPVFMPDGKDRTFAEMPLQEKNGISHRARAFAKFKAFLTDHA